MLHDAQVTTYLRVTAMFGFAFGLEEEINKLDEEYEGVISGFYVDETPSDLSDRSITQAMKIIKGMKKRNYKIAISAADSEWPIKLVSSRDRRQRADLLVLFDSTYSKYSQSCGEYGIGPFCRTSFAKKGFHELLRKRLSIGKVLPLSFGIIVTNVPPESVVEVMAAAQHNGVGNVFVTEKMIESDGPSYWDYILLNLHQDETCGCVDINECQENQNNCDENAFCHNTVGSYECTCAHGFSGDGHTHVNSTGCIKEVCAKCSDDSECDAQGACSCGTGFVGTGLACPEAGSFIPLSIPDNGDQNDICTDQNWVHASYAAIETIDTIVVVDLLDEEKERLIPCLKLLKSSGAFIYHMEPLWNGFKRIEVVEIKLNQLNSFIL